VESRRGKHRLAIGSAGLAPPFDRRGGLDDVGRRFRLFRRKLARAPGIPLKEAGRARGFNAAFTVFREASLRGQMMAMRQHIRGKDRTAVAAGSAADLARDQRLGGLLLLSIP
jgi:hypothetical protein